MGQFSPNKPAPDSVSGLQATSACEMKVMPLIFKHLLIMASDAD